MTVKLKSNLASEVHMLTPPYTLFPASRVWMAAGEEEKRCTESGATKVDGFVLHWVRGLLVLPYCLAAADTADGFRLAKSALRALYALCASLSSVFRKNLGGFTPPHASSKASPHRLVAHLRRSRRLGCRGTRRRRRGGALRMGGGAGGLRSRGTRRLRRGLR